MVTASVLVFLQQGYMEEQAEWFYNGGALEFQAASVLLKDYFRVNGLL